MTAHIKDKLSEFEEMLDGLANTVRALRKSGKDTKIAEVKLLNITPKIKMAHATSKTADLEKIKAALYSIEEEIEHIKNGYELENIIEVVRKAKQLIKQKKFAELSKLYSQISRMYYLLSKDDKPLIFALCKDLHERIKYTKKDRD